MESREDDLEVNSSRRYTNTAPPITTLLLWKRGGIYFIALLFYLLNILCQKEVFSNSIFLESGSNP